MPDGCASSEEDFLAVSDGAISDEDFLSGVVACPRPRIAEPESDEDFLACGHDGPLVSAGRPVEAAAAGGRPFVASLLSLNAASAYAPEAIAKRGRRIIPKAARPLVQSLQPLPADVLRKGVPRLVSFMLEGDAHRPTTLASSEKLR
eukprot:907320-Pyramimonas_sp.AAC.1